MTDIVDRLRALARMSERRDAELITEAADRIEGLRKDYVYWRAEARRLSAPNTQQRATCSPLSST
jgi:hypothetical protein